MSKRLASFGGPSAPTSSPVSGQSTASTPTKSGAKKKPTPASPNPRSTRPKLDVSGSGVSVHAPRKATKAQEETEIQRLVRTTLKRTSLDLAGWDKYCTKPGLQDAKSMVDQATELDNALGSFTSSEVQPRYRIVTDKLYNINGCRDSMRLRTDSMNRRFTILVKRANKLEQALTEFVQTNGIEAAERASLWVDKTWSLERHVLHMHQILRSLNRFQYTVRMLSEKIIAYGLAAGFNSNDVPLSESEYPMPGHGGTIPTFEETRSAMVLWAAEARNIEELVTEWNEMCALEVVGWDKKVEPDINSSDDEEEEDHVMD